MLSCKVHDAFVRNAWRLFNRKDVPEVIKQTFFEISMAVFFEAGTIWKMRQIRKTYVSQLNVQSLQL